MSNINDPNDPNYVVPGTSEPVAEYVVREPDPPRRVVPAPVEVEQPQSNLRWLWWLLGLLALAGLIWALTRACRTEEACTTVPTTVWTAESTNAYNAVSAYVPAGAEQTAVTNALRTLCDYRLAHVAQGTAGNWWDGNRVANTFAGIAGFEAANATSIQNVVNTAAWCRCS